VERILSDSTSEHEEARALNVANIPLWEDLDIFIKSQNPHYRHKSYEVNSWSS
jgi:hypothetical protein